MDTTGFIEPDDALKTWRAMLDYKASAEYRRAFTAGVQAVKRFNPTKAYEYSKGGSFEDDICYVAGSF